MDRRTALLTVVSVAGTLYGKVDPAPQGRVLNLVLDDVSALVVRYHGRVVTVRPEEVVAALIGKEP